MSFFQNLPTSVLQAGAIFLSIMIEALPFVLIGSIISGFIEVYITPDMVHQFLPKNKLLRILFGSLIGFFFPSCECGIVPIVHRFLEKKVPTYTAVPFLATAPVINPIVLFATYTAFGNSMRFALTRAFGSILVAIVLGIFLGFVTQESILKAKVVRTEEHHHHPEHSLKGLAKAGHALIHSIDEFFDTGRYLVFGCLFASLVQVYIPTRILTTIGHSPVTAILVMMLLAFLLSLCSEADAFIGASLLSSFGFAPVMAFLVIGPMIDVKNLLMMKNYFTTRFILQFMVLITVVILDYCLVIGGI
ncbi:permease [Streptococcus sp. X16XC17]|uniref:permease n=1 Tax=unclassified Streptococcus TaxID=2608887 RepID=UPI00066FDE8D|nr:MULTISPECIES: permease [unclassified Streptococcus]TCD46562.1 permease [Streptococcus sp. X16XC17]